MVLPKPNNSGVPTGLAELPHDTFAHRTETQQLLRVLKAPLLDVPPAVSPESLLRHIGDAHAQRLTRKKQKKLIKSREQDLEKYFDKLDGTQGRQIGDDIEIKRLAQQQERQGLVLESLQFQSVEGGNGAIVHRKSRTMCDYERELAKLGERIGRQQRKEGNDVEQHLSSAKGAVSRR